LKPHHRAEVPKFHDKISRQQAVGKAGGGFLKNFEKRCGILLESCEPADELYGKPVKIWHGPATVSVEG